MRIRWFVWGWGLLAVKAADAAAFADLCMRYGMVYCSCGTDLQTGDLYFGMTLRTAGLLYRRCEEENLCVRIVRRGGLPHLLYRYRHRFGLLLGAVLGLAVLIASTRVLWDIRISGNETMTVRQVREELRASGLYVGMPLSSLDTAQAEIRIQLDSDRISWASINMSGTVANIEIRERVPTPDDTPLQPANLVARCEGVIEELEIYRGNVVVQVGQAVHQNDLLVSGVYDSTAVGWRVTRAAGRVLARTTHEFSVEIPLTYEKKVYADQGFRQKTLIFFEKEIKLFKNSGILGVSCDRICNIETFTLGEGVSLPISVRTEHYLPYVYRPEQRDPLCAETLAYYELEQQIARSLPGAVLLRKRVTVTFTDETCRLYCKVWCLEDIAQPKEFLVSELSR